ncbi:hypothetical protein E3N88_38753 [Mikania micrantha]|uniref:Uncharacterized protein n=1 Tax=Mikania micrantha TaxID=192012 RepID=A0A5N6LUV4_9ASTR|nr:hypothetical protein E3N88_38753 [Mikania micrantha]
MEICIVLISVIATRQPSQGWDVAVMMSSENTQTDPAFAAAFNQAFTERIPNIVETIMGRLNHNQNNILPPPPLYPPPHIPNPPPYDPETHTDNTT